MQMAQSGGRFDFDDGGVYCGAWEGGKAHGQGVCTGPKGQGEYAGSWNHGFEVLGVYTWPSGNTYEGNWSSGKRHNLGLETKAKWKYKGEWTHGYRGRYGVRCSTTSKAKYEGTWNNGLQDGYGTETYADGGTYQGQWVGGMRQGLGIRESAIYQLASVVRGSFRISMTSLRSEQSCGTFSNNEIGGPEPSSGSRAGFVLSRRPVVPPQLPAPPKKTRLFRSGSIRLRRTILGGLKMRSKSSTSIASAVSNKSLKSTVTTDSLASTASDYNSLYDRGDLSSQLDPNEDKIDQNCVETYYGEWKNDTRTGFGVCKRSDGFMYEGEWLENYRHGYGSTTFPDGTKEEGKYKYNCVSYGLKKTNFPIKSGKLRTKVMHGVERSRRAKEAAVQKSDIAASRTAHSIVKAGQAETVAQNARDEAKIARCVARDQDPSFHQPGLEYLRRRGEDPFKDMEASQSYFMECERTEMEPESYHQYSVSNKGHNEQSSLTRTRIRDTDVISPSHSIQHDWANKDKSSQDKKTFYSHKDANLQIPTVKVESSDSKLEHHSQSTHTRQFLSPESANNVSYDISLYKSEEPTKQTVTDVALTKKQAFPKQALENNEQHLKSEVSSTCSFEHTTPRHKKSFFPSLRMRARKRSNAKDSGLGESTSSSTSKEKRNSFQDANKDSWTGESAEEKRKKFVKAYTMPNRANHSYSNRSMEVESFDFQNNQDRYLAGYETEMRENEIENSHDLQKTSMCSLNSYEYITSSEPPANPSIARYISAEHVAIPAAAGNSSSQTQTCTTNHQSLNSSTNFLQPPSGRSIQRQRRNARAACEISPQDSLSDMTALRPRSSINGPQPVNLPPTPAFANYTIPVSSEELNSSEYQTKINLHKVGNNREQLSSSKELAYEDDFDLAIPLSQDENASNSPLPGKLRRNTKPDVDSIGEAFFGDKHDTDTTKVYLIILVLLLNVGFLALFIQFFT